MDYRESHKNRGGDYHRKFAEGSYRGMIWSLERDALGAIVSERFGTSRFTHLDFACGTGRVLDFVRPSASESVGVDVSEAMLHVARENGFDGELICADLTRSDVLEGRKFDLITAFRFFPNAQPELRREAIECLVPHLAPGGALVFNNHKNSSSLLYQLGRLVRGSGQRDMSSREAERLVADAGLQIASVKHVGLLPATQNFRPLPLSLMEHIERRVMRMKCAKSLCANLIYECAHVE